MGGMAWLILGASVALSAPACQSFNAYCTEKVDCENGNDLDIDACEVAAQRAADRASIFGCSTEFNALQDCVEFEASCDKNDLYTVDDNCNEESADFNYCMQDVFDGGGQSNDQKSSGGN